MKTSGYYEEKAWEEEKRDKQKAMETYHKDTAPGRHPWEEYLERHPILAFLAEGVLPERQKIDRLDTYFAKERQDYLKATEKGPQDPKTGRPMWNLDRGERADPRRANAGKRRTAIREAYEEVIKEEEKPWDYSTKRRKTGPNKKQRKKRRRNNRK